MIIWKRKTTISLLFFQQKKTKKRNKHKNFPTYHVGYSLVTEIAVRVTILSLGDNEVCAISCFFECKCYSDSEKLIKKHNKNYKY